MLPSQRSFFAVIFFLVCSILIFRGGIFRASSSQGTFLPSQNHIASDFQWSTRHEHYPVSQHEPLPQPNGIPLPRVQYAQTGTQTAENLARQDHVKATLQRAWTSYKKCAWLKDELTPISGGSRTTFGGWAATLVDTLDTLWIMGLTSEFNEAVDAAVQIDFTRTTADGINVFETTIRYMGGFLAAYDLSGDMRLLAKCIELADMLYAAFDTPNRMPVLRWDVHSAASQETAQVAHPAVLVAEIGSLTLEFTRLSQITGDLKWYDAVARVMAVFEAQQNTTHLPGMWPLVVNARDKDFHSGSTFTLGAMADSLYEYLPKMIALLGGSEQYSRMYEFAMETAAHYTLFKPMTLHDADILMTGPVNAQEDGIFAQPEGQHLACYAGGMFALGGRLLDLEKYVDIGRKLTDGCIWAYETSLLGIMPEKFTVVPCQSASDCQWDEAKWHAEVKRRLNQGPRMNALSIIQHDHLQPGFSSITDRRYILRPEAIESIFILYRVTGDSELQHAAWQMYQNIVKYTETPFANAAIEDVTVKSAPKLNSMESFWTAETLKYFFLVFSEPDLISLDEFVFNTEAHPFRRPAV